MHILNASASTGASAFIPWTEDASQVVVPRELFRPLDERNGDGASSDLEQTVSPADPAKHAAELRVAS